MRFIHPRIAFALAIIFSFQCILPLSAHAQSSSGIYSVSPGAMETINRHGICRKVTNGSSSTIMVPTGTTSEWGDGQGSFLKNVASMPGISVSTCAHADSPLLSQMVHETCYWGESAKKPSDCTRTRGANAGQFISDPSPKVGHLWLDGRPKCRLEGKTGSILTANPTNSPAKNTSLQVSWETMMQVLNLELPTDALRFPSGINECILNVQVNHTGTDGGFFVSYIFRR